MEIKKLKITPKKGNISILVILILVASSLIGILTTNYIKDMMQYNDIINGYYKSYYLSRAGLEIALTEIKNNGIGFENTINYNDPIITSNILCKTCKFYSSISGNSTYFSNDVRKDGSNCNNPIILGTGKSFILPLFKQINNGTNYQKLTNTPSYQNLSEKAINIQLENLTPDKEITLGIFVISGFDLLQDGVFVKGIPTNNFANMIKNFISEFENYGKNILVGTYTLNNAYKNNSTNLKTFLIFANTKEGQPPISFCLNVEKPLGISLTTSFPTSTFYIRNIGNNIEKTIGLEGFLKQPIPEFLGHTYLSY